MTYGEAWRLTRILLNDPASHVAAASAGWEHPASRESLVLMDLFDVTMAVNAGKKRPTPYPRPWPVDDGKRRTKPDADITQDQIIAALRAAGHTAALPGAA